MLSAVTSGISTVITWIGTVISAIVGENSAMSELLPLFAIGVSISAILLGMESAEMPSLNWAKTVEAEMLIP